MNFKLSNNINKNNQFLPVLLSCNVFFNVINCNLKISPKFQNQSYESYDQQLEDEQDMMGLYESELTKQILLRKRQRQEWDMMKKKKAAEEEQIQNSNKEEEANQEQREEERIEIEETRVSKGLASEMVRTSLGDQGDTLKRVVDVLQNQNGKL